MEATEKAMMDLIYDERADAAFVDVGGPIPPGSVDSTEELDQDRNVKYDAADRIVRYEFLNVRRFGVRVNNLPHREELARLFGAAGFRVLPASGVEGSGSLPGGTAGEDGTIGGGSAAGEPGPMRGDRGTIGG